MKMRNLGWSSLFIMSVCSATVIIHNETLVPLNTGIYYYDYSGTSRLTTPQVTVAPGATVELQEQSISLLKDRYIYADTKPLAPILSYEDFKTVAKIRVRLPGHYYLAMKDGRIKGYTLIEWHILHPFSVKAAEVRQLISQSGFETILRESYVVKNNPYKQTSVTVRQSAGLCAEEEVYRAKRKPRVKTALEKLLARPLNGKYIPEITIILSGGGYRAMLYTAGSLVAVHNAGLFDAVTYIAALSGSSWALSYIAFESLYRKKPVEQSMYDLVAKSTQNLASVNPKELALIFDVVSWKSAFDLPMTTVDLYGLLLGNVLFSEYGVSRHWLCLSSQQQLLADGSYPLPIYTAVPGETTEFEKVMYEFTPYEVCAPWGFAIPSYAFGSRFINGSRVGIRGVYPPEQPMSILLGTFGSAYAFTLQRAYEEVEKRMSADIKQAVATINVAKSIGQKRIAAALFDNFMLGMQASPLKNRKNLKMADAGLGITGGLPFQPVDGLNGRRKADLYIIVDMSEEVDDAIDLRRVARYMSEKKLKFPAVPAGVLEKQMVTILRDDADPDVPAVVYLPRVKDQTAWQQYKIKPEFEQYKVDLETFTLAECLEKSQGQGCTTFNLQYKFDVARKVARLAQFNMAASMEEIKGVINQIINRKSTQQS